MTDDIADRMILAAMADLDKNAAMVRGLLGSAARLPKQMVNLALAEAIHVRLVAMTNNADVLRSLIAMKEPCNKLPDVC